MTLQEAVLEIADNLEAAMNQWKETTYDASAIGDNNMRVSVEGQIQSLRFSAKIDQAIVQQPFQATEVDHRAAIEKIKNVMRTSKINKGQLLAEEQEARMVPVAGGIDFVPIDPTAPVGTVFTFEGGVKYELRADGQLHRLDMRIEMS